MSAIQQTVTCDLPGLGDVTVTYNLMATGTQIEAWTQALGQGDGVIVSIDGWPKEYGTDPFGDDAPLAFRLWAVRTGFQDAIRAFVADPNS